MICQQCIKYEKKIQVLQCDFQFQLRKLSQDKSTEKALYEINVQKQMRKWQQKYSKEKIDHEEDHKKWFKKIDQLSLEYTNKIKQIQQICQSTILNHQQKCLKQSKEAEILLDNQHKLKIKHLTQRYQSQIQEKQKHWRALILKKQEESTKQINTLNKNSAERQAKKKSQYQSLILGLKSQLNAQLKSNSSNQQEFRRQKMRFISEIYTHKQKIISLQNVVLQLKKKIDELEQQLQKRKEQIINLQISHSQNIKNNKNHYQNLLKLEEIKLEDKIKEFCQNQLQITKRYEESIKRLQENRMVQMKLYESNLFEIKNCIEKRPSRIEDIQQILTLKDRLNKKEKQYQTIERELKTYQLQLQNKEDIYNKIFIPSVNSTHLYGENALKRKQIKIKRPIGKSVSTVRQILNSVGGSNNLPILNNLQKKMLPPKSNKIL